jgi:hypothetical protein
MSTNYAIEVRAYAERHFISKFKKKYKNSWDITWNAIIEEFKRIETLLGVSSIAETVVDNEDHKICKTEFRIAGTQQSRHRSGNRCIIAVHEKPSVVYILLVYSKGDVMGPHETAWWKKVIKNNYPDYSQYL